ncbi:ankyrin repeat domain-containing protein [Novosphingobium flavum]|uniref:ankyrin repeat domain-containing protein n=1 Tax=Novosphingobium aerophilum TaxID=2839843 RepID=UPI00163A7E60|nr:ankyrin repeat domain-containing protein [Novosphingobium aerophilum]MBC2661038.1 ankyrin repeat domain-containing protein [Novosphingobium aerophilum]
MQGGIPQHDHDQEQSVQKVARFGRTAMVAALALALALPGTAGAQVMSVGYKFLEAVKKKDGEAVEKALNDSATIINTRDVTTGDSALHVVSQRRDYTWLNFLLFKGANANIRNDRGVTPLGIAVSLSWPEGAQLLIDRGARINDPDNNGETPLIAAVHQRNIELVRLLLKAGADAGRADNSGRSARDYANLLGPESSIANEVENAAKAAAKRKQNSYGPSF